MTPRPDDPRLARLHRQRLHALGKQGDVAGLIEELPNPYDAGGFSVRFRAVQLLGEIAGEEAVDPLLPLLRDRSETVRGGTAKALGLVGSSAATAALIECLSEAPPAEPGRRGRSASS